MLSMKRPMAPWDSFFHLGNVERELWIKKASVQAEAIELDEQIACGIDGCKAVLPTIFAYETHYASAHLHKCSTCHRVMPSCRLLSLHIMEAHDSFFAEMAKREDMFECLVEGCPKKFKGDFQRERHLIDAHHFPKNFHFVFHPTRKAKPVDKPSRRRDRRKKKSTLREFHDGDEGVEISMTDVGCAQGANEPMDASMEDLCASMQSMSAPTKVRFGRGSSSAFRAGRGEKENGKDIERIKDRGTGRGTLRSARGRLGIRGISQGPGFMMTDGSGLCREIAGLRDEDGVVAEMES